MELDIGKHCELKTCRQLDFCPFLCHHCKKNFCLEHRTADSHKCPSTMVKPLPVPKHKPTIIKCDICNRTIQNHIITPYKCSKCNINTCSTHRYLDAHQCKSLGKVLTGSNHPRSKFLDKFEKNKSSASNNSNKTTNVSNATNVSNVSNVSNATNATNVSNASCFPCNILSTGDNDSEKK